MAKIPTINAQNITPPPGTAGGVLLGRVGTSNIQVRTPLTQQMNPANFGQQGAMVAQLGNTLLNNVFLPMQEKVRANARSKQSMEEQTKLLREINDVKGKLEKKELIFGEDYHHPAGLESAWDRHWQEINTQIDFIIPDINHLNDLVIQVRRDILRQVHKVNSGHPGGSLGCTEFFVALYQVLMDRKDGFDMDGKGEDLFFLSNGHISPVFYSVLARSGYFPVDELNTFRLLDSRLQGHPTTHEGLPGVR